MIAWRSLCCAAIALTISCGDFTKVTNTGVIEPDATNSAVGAAAWYVGATRQFVNASLSAIQYSGIVSDELIDANAIGSLHWSYLDSRRTLPPTHALLVAEFSTLSSALVGQRFALAQLQQFAPTPGSRLGQMYAYQGYLELYLAEHLCSGVPISTVDFDGTVTYGSGTSTTEIFDRAIAHFDSAIAVTPDSQRVINLARLGKARALLGKGDFANAATTAAAIPTSFVYNLDINSAVAGLTNSLYNAISVSRSMGIAPAGDGTNGINWVGANDRRVPTTLLGNGTDGSTVIYAYGGFTGLGSAVRVASGLEARLIEAEAALQANNNDAATTGSGWLGILNNLRATAIAPALSPLADPGNYPARVNLLFREKAFWLFLNGTRMGDLRRLVRQYGRAENTVFPSGTYARDGQPYGTEVTLVPTPAESVNNPKYSGCFDKNA